MTFALGGVIITKLSARADANEFDKINELLIERTAKKFERASKNKLKKFLTNEKFCDKINELIRVGTAKILDN